MQVRVGILTAPHIDFIQYEKTFVLKHVRIGIGFHWDRLEDQEFAGTLEIIHNPDGTETAVNIIDMEDYLCSVISSEMSADSPLELLKAHAVISRSWLIRAVGHTDHVGYDVCADDHCQRYEGLRRMKDRAVQAVQETQGQVLTYAGEVCDCRYHKCCGGRTERFSTCWEDIDLPYLQSVECPYCGEADSRQSLNDYDQETTDYHDWQVTYTQQELHDILLEKTGIDFGDIVAITPLRRGASGRIYELKIVGTRATKILSKELTIRRAFSRTCLYSSWFDIHSTPSSLHFIGHGWGHGVGLCQIGAAEMAKRGCTYQHILSFYYPNTQLKQV
ncbi:MAG: SpoIID/LytB domain-containing protein [Bacteroidales bacterium]|nr:SpoIID/LytB domain-containing protein [Bacteroidales bacterium]